MNVKDKKKLLIISIDSVGTVMSGAGLRYVSLAQALSASCDVTLAVPNENPPEMEGIQTIGFNPDHISSLNVLLDSYTNVLVSGIFALRLKGLKKTKAKIIIDLYDPILLENLFYANDKPIKYRVFNHFRSTQLTNHLTRIGDFFICGSERQRDFWLGVLAANGRINPVNFEVSSDFRRLIDVVGFGLPERNIKPGSFLRKRYPLVEENTKIVLWGGGVWDWLNPMPLLKIWKNILKNEPSAKLVFLGIEHPNPLVPKHKIVDVLINESKRIREFEKSVFFIKWLSLADREKLLSESHLGVTLHKGHIETHFSVRTRVLDYIWAKLPILISEGDITSEWVQDYHLGEVVQYQDEIGLENAMIRLLRQNKQDFQEYFDPVIKKMYWSEMIQPLENFCKNGQKAPDKELIGSFSYGSLVGKNLNYLFAAIKLGQVDEIFNKIRSRMKR